MEPDEGVADRSGAPGGIADRQAEAALQSSATLLQATEHLTRVGGWMWDVDARRMTWTSELYRIHGFTPDEIEPGSDEHIVRSLECYDEADRQTVLAAFQRCATEGQPYDLQVPFANAQGERLWVRTTAQPVWAGGKVVGVVGNLQDITEHKSVEEELARQAALLDAIREAQSLFILRRDPRQVFHDLLHILVTTTDSQFGFLLELHYDAEDVPYLINLALSDIAWDEGSRRLYAQLEARDLEFRNLNNLAGAPVTERRVIIANDPPHDPRSGGLPPGHPPLGSYLGIPLYVGQDMVGVAGVANRPGGYTPEMAVFLEPLTSTVAGIIWALQAAEREQQALAELQRSEAQVHAILDNIPDSAWLKDREGHFIAVNQAFADRAGCSSPAEAVGRTDADFWPADVVQAFRRDDATVMDSAHELRIEESVLVNGETRTFETFKRPLYHGPGEIAGTVGIARDITERKRAEEALERSLAEKEVLLREVHHRVKNNLASIVGLLELQLATLDDATVEGLMREVGSRIKAMSIVHELLYQSETLSEIDLHDYLTALVAGLPATFNHHRRIRIEVLAPRIPVSLDTAIPCGLIIHELVTNALKYAFPDGQPRPGAGECRVTVRADWDGTHYTLQVTDNGGGLPVDLDWTATQTLGLRLVRMLGLHQLQGQIDLDRSGGTAFRLRFAPDLGQRR